jgi:hypothetical protein
MDCLRIVALAAGSYVGVYQVGRGTRFSVLLATSSNLRAWHEVETLETDASQPDLVAAGGGFFLAAEADTDATLHPGIHFIAIRYYQGARALLMGQPSRIVNLPHRLARRGRGIEGTPVIESAWMSGDLKSSVLKISFHYLAHGAVDREGVGVLTGFAHWSASGNAALDGALLKVGAAGKHGDRSYVPGTSGQFEIVEAQRSSAARWEVYEYSQYLRSARLLHITTPGGSTSFANPTMTCVPLTGHIYVALFTLFLPDRWAADGEAGELLYYRTSSLCGRYDA